MGIANGPAQPRAGSRRDDGWQETIRSNVFAGIGIACGVISVGVLIVAVFLPPLFFVAITPVFLALLAAGTYKAAVTIDGAGVRVDWGMLRWPHTSASLDQITGVRTDTVKPLHWGGWGYRSGDDGVGVIIRGGPAIVVYRRHSQPLYITVPHADDAADALTRLLPDAER